MPVKPAVPIGVFHPSVPEIRRDYLPQIEIRRDYLPQIPSTILPQERVLKALTTSMDTANTPPPTDDPVLREGTHPTSNIDRAASLPKPKLASIWVDEAGRLGLEDEPYGSASMAPPWPSHPTTSVTLDPDNDGSMSIPDRASAPLSTWVWGPLETPHASPTPLSPRVRARAPR